MSDREPHKAQPSGTDWTVGDTVQQEELAKRSLSELSEQRVRELAQEAIGAWQKSEAEDKPRLLKPKTWSTRTVGGTIAVAFLALLIGVYELAQFPKCMHGLLIAAARQARGDALPTMPMRWNHRR